MACGLSVNLNAVALLRNRRNLPWPNIIELGRIALDNGAMGLTVHPRPDQRHTRASDVHALKSLVNEPAFKGKELNLEGYPDERFLSLCEDATPHQVTFVPDLPGQETSDHGWDIAGNTQLLEQAISRMKVRDARVALFIDADPQMPHLAKQIGADRVELFTGPYGSALPGSKDAAAALKALLKTALASREAGLAVNAGHDLTVANVPVLLKAIPEIVEMSIGHGLTADALYYGMAETVKRFNIAMNV